MDPPPEQFLGDNPCRQALRDLFMLLQGNGEYSAEEFGRAVRKVLDKGKEIIDLAQQAKESYESDCG